MLTRLRVERKKDSLQVMPTAEAQLFRRIVYNLIGAGASIVINADFAGVVKLRWTKIDKNH